MKRRVFLACFCCLLQGQEAPQVVTKPNAPAIVRPYLQAKVAPVSLRNSGRLAGLIRGGKLYLTIQDTLAAAIENNLDLAVDRYGLLIAQWTLTRLQAGGPLRGVTNGSSLVNQATSGQGVQGSQLAAGLSQNGNGNNGSGQNAIISQIGPVTQNLDPVLQNATAYSHTTQPQANTVQSQTNELIDIRHISNTFVQQGLITGGFVQLTANEQYLKENTPTDILNPSVAPVVQLYVRHNFLNSFGVGVNSRFIRVARNNVTGAGETFRSQLLNLIASVLNLYYDLVSRHEELNSRRASLNLAQKFYDDTAKRIQLGAIARVELYRAEAELSTRKQEVAIAEASVRQQETLLKGAITRDLDPAIDGAEIVPLDRIEPPQSEALPPLRDLLARALSQRPDLALAKITDENATISALGTANGLLPTLQGIAALTDAGLAGVAVPQPDGSVPNPSYVGNLGTAYGQVFRHDFPTRRAAVLFQATPGNHIAQADYGIEQLQLRQGDLLSQRSRNQLVVDISNQMVALRQASGRYTTAVNTRTLQEQLLDKEQQKFSLGSSTIDDVIAVQRSLAAARTSEIQALSVYSHARVSLDQVLGETLEKNHVSLREAIPVQAR